VHHFTRTEGKSPEQAISKDDLIAEEGLGGGRGEGQREDDGQQCGLGEFGQIDSFGLSQSPEFNLVI
jgi:hypothetical protein